MGRPSHSAKESYAKYLLCASTRGAIFANDESMTLVGDSRLT
jgi:hypothetical protein